MQPSGWKPRRNEELVELGARVDTLTGLPDRDAAGAWLEGALVSGWDDVTVVIVDIEQFAAVNESVGGMVADWVLVEAARRLVQCPGAGLVARVGADEFVVVCRRDDCDVARLADAAAGAVRDAGAAASLELDSHVAVCDVEPGDSPDEVLTRCGLALAHAKNVGSGVRVDVALREVLVKRLAAETQLARAIEEHELVLAYQPSWDTTTGACTGLEALVRWRHPEHGVLAPGQFVPVAEESGAITALGIAVLDDAAKQVASWRRSGVAVPRVWVNVSVRQLREKFAGEVAGVLVAHGLSGNDLGIEVTETVELDDDAHVLEQLRFVRLLGVAVALDDFGTGYSSLAALKRQGFDVVKIDRTLTSGSVEPFGGALVRAAVDVAHAMGARVLAEGVEDAAQIPALRDSGVDSVSGFALAHPLWPHDVPEAVLRNLADEGLLDRVRPEAPSVTQRGLPVQREHPDYGFEQG